MMTKMKYNITKINKIIQSSSRKIKISKIIILSSNKEIFSDRIIIIHRKKKKKLTVIITPEIQINIIVLAITFTRIIIISIITITG